MNGVFVSVLLMSATGTLLYLLLSALRLITKKTFGGTWHYRMCIVILVFMLLPIGTVGGSLLSELPGQPESGPVMAKVMLDELMELGQSDPITYAPPQSGQNPSQAAPVPVSKMPKSFGPATLLPFLPPLWLAGVICYVFLQAFRLIRFRKRLSKTCRAVEDTDALGVLHRTMGEMGVKGTLTVLSSDYIKTPMLVGLFKTSLILPEVEMNGRELSVILRHELVHFKRRDLLIKASAKLVNAIHWFNPAAYMLTKSIDDCCEISCDEQVVKGMTIDERQFYGETILNILCRVVSRHAGLYTTLAESKKGIERRLNAMMNVKENTKRIALISVVAAAVLCLAGFTVASVLNADENNGASSLAKGAYVSEDETIKFCIYEQSCQLFSLAMSYVPSGTYALDGNQLTLSINDYTYTFRVRDGQLIYESGNTPEDILKKGAALRLSEGDYAADSLFSKRYAEETVRLFLEAVGENNAEKAAGFFLHHDLAPTSAPSSPKTRSMTVKSVIFSPDETQRVREQGVFESDIWQPYLTKALLENIVAVECSLDIKYENEEILQLRKGDPIYFYLTRENDRSRWSIVDSRAVFADARSKMDSIYTVDGITVTVPGQYAELVVADTEVNDQLMQIYALYYKPSHEGNEEIGLGCMLSLHRCDYEQMLRVVEAGGRTEFIARKGGHYYYIQRPTDAQWSTRAQQEEAERIAESITISIGDLERFAVKDSPTGDEQEMLSITEAGKEFVRALIARNQPPNARDEDCPHAVEAFERFFKLDTLYVSGVHIDPQMPETYICYISGKNRNGYDRSVTVYFSRDDVMTWYCGLVDYSAYSKTVTESYVKLIQDGDAEGIARLLYEGEEPDEGTVEAAQQTVSYLNRVYDLSSFVIAPHDVLDNGFVYEVTDAGGNDRFQVTLRYGDGMCVPVLLGKLETN